MADRGPRLSVADRAPRPHPGRPVVAVVTTHWCADTDVEPDEPAMVARLVAGALSRQAAVSVVHLVSATDVRHPEVGADSVFTRYTVPVRGASPGATAVVRAALGATGAPPASATGALFERLAGRAPGVPALLDRLAPDAVLLIGHRQPWDVATLGAARRSPGTAVATRRHAPLWVIPLLEDPGMVGLPHLGRLLALADVIGAVHPGEERALRAAPRPPHGDVVALDVAIPVSPPGRWLFGIEPGERYVAVLRSLGGREHRPVRPVSSEVLGRALGAVALVEVDGEEWWCSRGGNRALLPVRPSRVNLWRLMEHALATIDVRSQGPFGREAVESMLLGTPVLVPQPGAAMEHARAASGGLWFRGVAELLDAAGVLVDDQVGRRLGAQGAAYASVHHGDAGGFVERVARLVPDR